MSNNKKNYKLLNNNKRNNSNRITNIQREESEEDINDDYDEPLELLPCREEEEDNRIQINTSSNDEDEDDEEEEEENSLATSTTTLFKKIKDNISSSFRKIKDEEKQEQQVDLEEQDEESNIDYSYYTDSPNTSGSNNTDLPSINSNQVPLYSINSTPAWFIRSNDPYSLENHIINHMRSNSRIDVIQQQQATQAAAPLTTNNTVQEHITSDGVFRPFSSHFINEQHQLSEQQDNLIKEKDIVIIRQPNNRISIGFSDSKFNSYLKTGEHNPGGFYNSFIQNDQMIQRLALLTSPELAGGAGTGGILGDSGSEYSDFGIYRLSHFELEKRKKMFLSILCIQIFYYCILLSSFSSFSPLIIFLFIGLLNNCLALISIRKENVLGLSFYLFFEISMIGINYFVDLTTLFILRLVLFLIGYKLRQEMLLLQSSVSNL